MFHHGLSNIDDSVFEPIVKEANDAIIVAEENEKTGPGFHIVYINEAFTRIFGYAADEALGKSPRMLQGRDTCADTIREISTTVHRGGSIHRRIQNYDKFGQSVWVDVNIVPLHSDAANIRRFAAIERDVTKEVEYERQLAELAFADSLTALGNRRHFDSILDQEISRSARSGVPLCLGIIDIDHFKAVNDTWGHQIGDRVLIAVAKAIKQSVRNYDYVARIGGEEFAVVLPGAAQSDGVRIIARTCAGIRSRARVGVDDQTVSVTCSAGITSLAAAHDTAESLVARADRALYGAKNSGRDRVVEIIPEPAPEPAVELHDVSA